MSKKIKYFYHNGTVMDAKGEKGEDGADGAQGPAGPQGRPGIDRQPVESGDVMITQVTGGSEELVMSQRGVSFPLNQTKYNLGGYGQTIQLSEIGYISSNGELGSVSGYHRTDKIAVEIGMSIKYKGRINRETFPCVAGYSEDESYYGALLPGSPEGYADYQTIYIPAGVAYIAVASTDGADTSVLMNYGLAERVNSNEAEISANKLDINTLAGRVNSNEAEISANKSEISVNKSGINSLLATIGGAYELKNEGYINQYGEISTLVSDYVHTDAIPVNEGTTFYYKGEVGKNMYPSVAGYNSDEISRSSYVGAILVGGTYSDLQSFVIPSGVTHIVAVSKSSVPYELSRPGLAKRIQELEAEMAQIHPIYALPNEYYGKKINWIGDSITAGADFDEMVCEYFGLTETDYGINGSTIAADENDTRNSIALRYTGMSDDADVIVVSAGTNDYQYAHTPVGSINDTDVHTFYGALKVLCEGLIAKYPTKLVFFTTPIKRNQSPLNASSNDANTLGYTLSQYADIIKEVCALYSIPVCDLWRESYLNPHLAAQASMFDGAGTHPNNEGRALMARRVRGFMKQLM